MTPLSNHSTPHTKIIWNTEPCCCPYRSQSCWSSDSVYPPSKIKVSELVKHCHWIDSIATCKQLVWSIRIGRNMPIWVLKFKTVRWRSMYCRSTVELQRSRRLLGGTTMNHTRWIERDSNAGNTPGSYWNRTANRGNCWQYMYCCLPFDFNQCIVVYRLISIRTWGSIRG
jgi:hypothetical protein